MTNNTAANTAVKKAKKKSTVRHTRAIQRDRSKRLLSMPTDQAMTERITEFVHPATLAQVGYFHQLGLRERILTLPVMMAVVLSMIWRQIGSVQELTRVVQEESLLWAEPQPKLTEKAMNARLRSLPADLFWLVLSGLLPLLQKRWEERKRPLTPELAWARARYTGGKCCGWYNFGRSPAQDRLVEGRRHHTVGWTDAGLVGFVLTSPPAHLV